MAMFLLLMFIGESLQSKSLPASIEPIAAIGLVLMGIYATAMFLALKRERIGSLLGVVALGAFFVIMFMGLFPGNVSGGFSTKGVLNPVFLVLWLPIILYLLCLRLESRGKETIDITEE